MKNDVDQKFKKVEFDFWFHFRDDCLEKLDIISLKETIASLAVEHFLTIFVITFALLLNPPKCDGKYGQEMFNWLELHSERSNF